MSQRQTTTAHAAPTICMMTNEGTCINAMPANVSLKLRAIVTAGLANDVESVNH